MKIHTIDLQFRGREHLIASYLVEGREGLALVETGPASTIEAARRGVEALGFSTDDIRHVLVTHIHADHSGGAWWWAEQGAQVYVHPRGVRHLADPAKLRDGMRLVYGEAMDDLWGELRPIPEENLTVVEDGGRIEAGDLVFTAWDTPGHARHHHVYLTEDVAFTGDLAGVRLPDSRYVSVTGAPSQFDPVAYDESLARLEAADVKRMFLTHFGAFDDVPEHLGRYREQVQRASEEVCRAIEEGADDGGIEATYTAFCRERAEADGVREEDWALHELGNSCEMNAAGISLYWRRKKEKEG